MNKPPPLLSRSARALVSVPKLPPSARALVESGRLAHLVTHNNDGSPHVTAVWVGMDGDQLVVGSTGRWKKVRNIENNPGVALCMDADTYTENVAQNSLIVYGTATVEAGGVYSLLSRLSRAYLDEQAASAYLARRFPGGDDPSIGYVVRIKVARIAGLGPWISGD